MFPHFTACAVQLEVHAGPFGVYLSPSYASAEVAEYETVEHVERGVMRAVRPSYAWVHVARDHRVDAQAGRFCHLQPMPDDLADGIYPHPQNVISQVVAFQHSYITRLASGLRVEGAAIEGDLISSDFSDSGREVERVF